jgi:putative phosphoribosyl transferase
MRSPATTGKARFRDRSEAGRLLARELEHYAGDDDVIVLALPRGGVPVGYEVAKELGAPLDVFVVRKLGVPGHEELALGAVASGGVRVLDKWLISRLGLGREAIERVTAAELREIERREEAYRGNRGPPSVAGKTVILVDDGLATGATMRAASLAVRQLHPKRIVVAVPVAAAETCDEFRDDVDEIVCALTPKPFGAVGMWYDDFSQTTDDEVRQLLARASGGAASPPSVERTNVTETDVAVPVEGAVLEGTLSVPEAASGLVVFAHGSGSGRRSPRNRRVATTLNEAGIGTLLIDLLTPDEERADRVTGEHRFDIGLLAHRVLGTIDWLRTGPGADFRIGLFGASSGAAAALVAAAERPDFVSAVVSRGGRPDLAGSALRRVQAPTLLIVGGADEQVLELNRRALALLPGKKRLVVVPGATHLFEEPGALEEVARLAADWFTRFLTADADGR